MRTFSSKRHVPSPSYRSLPAVGKSLVVILAFFTQAASALAQSSPPLDHAPQACSGFNSELGNWSMVGSSPGSASTVCGANQAFYGVSTIQKSSVSRDGRKVMIVGNCCPLPATDMLTEEHLEVPGRCPNGYVVTGARLSELPPACTVPAQSDRCRYEASAKDTILRCTKVNLERYELGSPKPSLTVGLTGHLRESFEQRVARSSIPVAIRYGIGRSERKRFANRTCVGTPWGAVLTAVDGKVCSQVEFSQFQFRGRTGDPPQGSPVRMFPECDLLDHPTDTVPVCRRYVEQ